MLKATSETPVFVVNYSDYRFVFETAALWATLKSAGFPLFGKWEIGEARANTKLILIYCKWSIIVIKMESKSSSLAWTCRWKRICHKCRQNAVAYSHDHRIDLTLILCIVRINDTEVIPRT